MPSVLLLGALMWPQVLPLRIGLHRRTRFFAMCVMTAVLIFFSAIRICAGFFARPLCAGLSKCAHRLLVLHCLLHTCCVSRSSYQGMQRKKERVRPVHKQRKKEKVRPVHACGADLRACCWAERLGGFDDDGRRRPDFDVHCRDRSV